jgi:hypothetical protein
MDILAQGTELADLDDGILISKFLIRIRERVIHLTGTLINKVFLNCELGGTAVQTKTFRHVWSRKEVYFQAAGEDAALKGLSDDEQNDCDGESRRRNRPQTWTLRDDDSCGDVNLPAPKRQRRAQKSRAKRPITPQFPNLRPKPAVRSSVELAAMATTALGIARPSSGEQESGDFVVPPADNMVTFFPNGYLSGLLTLSRIIRNDLGLDLCKEWPRLNCLA